MQAINKHYKKEQLYDCDIYRAMQLVFEDAIFPYSP